MIIIYISKKILYRLDHILFLSVLAQLMGAIDYNQISIWIKNFIQTDKIKKLLGVEFIRTPGRSVISQILADVDYKKLEIVFRKWIGELVDTTLLSQLAVDGKAMRGSKVNGIKSTEVLNAVLADNGIILAHKKIKDKSNEVPALRELIDELDNTFIYTFDAMNTKKTLDKIEKDGSRYYAKLKGNQKTLLKKALNISKTKKATDVYLSPFKKKVKL